MTDVLYRWPAAATFGRRVPKNKFYERGPVTAAVRARFVAEIQRVTWAYKLAEETVNLPGSAAVPEIQVFQVDAKGVDVSESVLTAIDKAVKTPIIFEISRGLGPERRTRMTAALKQLGAGVPKVGVHFSTRWLPEDVERQRVPAAVSLDSLYTALLESLTPVQLRGGEGVAEIAERLEALRKLEREINALQRKIRSEPQLNRKVELAGTLKAKQASLAELTSPGLQQAPSMRN